MHTVDNWFAPYRAYLVATVWNNGLVNGLFHSARMLVGHAIICRLHSVSDIMHGNDGNQES